MAKRAPIDLGKGSAPRSTQLDLAAQIIDRSGLAPAIQQLTTQKTGRPRNLTEVRALLIAAQANALTPHHTAHIASVGRVIDSLETSERHDLGITSWDRTTGYVQVHRFLDLINEALVAGPTVQVHGQDVKLDHQEFVARILKASLPDDLPSSSSVALDSTALETWGALYGDPASIEQLDPDDDTPTTGKRRGGNRKVLVLGVGEDGRDIFTADKDARGGRRSATNSRSAGGFVGYDLHLVVATRDITSTNYIDAATSGPPVPNLILAAALAPANTHAGTATVPILERLHRDRPDLRDLIVDQGYSSKRPGTFFAPLRQLGFRPVFELHPQQRGQRPFAGDALLIDGGLYSAHLPDALFGSNTSDGRRSLPMPPMGATWEQRLKFQEPFNRRAQYRYGVHSGPDSDGYRRMRCPFCSGRAKALELPETMRKPATVPILPIDGTPAQCCSGTLTASAADLTLWQDIPFGTSAWFKSYRRRNAVESVNGALQGQFVNLVKGYQAFLRADKITLMLSFTLAAVNIDRARSFRAKHELETPPTYCRKRRAATNAHLIAEETARAARSNAR